MNGMMTEPMGGGYDLRRVAFWTLLPAPILLLPLIAMQLTDEVLWTAYDFAFAGTVLCGAGLVYALATGWTARFLPKAAIGFVVLLAVMINWAWAVN
jgi:hypothetical protein